MTKQPTLQKLQTMVGKTIASVTAEDEHIPEECVITFTDGTSIKVGAENMRAWYTCITAEVLIEHPDPDHS